MVPQLKVDKQQLNDMEAATSAEAPRPVDGKCFLISPWTWMLTDHDSFMVPLAGANPVNNHVNDSEPTLPLPVTTA